MNVSTILHGIVAVVYCISKGSVDKIKDVNFLFPSGSICWAEKPWSNMLRQHISSGKKRCLHIYQNPDTKRAPSYKNRLKCPNCQLILSNAALLIPVSCIFSTHHTANLSPPPPSDLGVVP